MIYYTHIEICSMDPPVIRSDLSYYLMTTGCVHCIVNIKGHVLTMYQTIVYRVSPSLPRKRKHSNRMFRPLRKPLCTKLKEIFYSAPPKRRLLYT